MARACATARSVSNGAAVLARAGDKQLMVAVAATDVREALREVAARQIASELALDIPRQRPGVVLSCVTEKVVEVLPHELVEHRLGRLPRNVRRGEEPDARRSWRIPCHIDGSRNSCGLRCAEDGRATAACLFPEVGAVVCTYD